MPGAGERAVEWGEDRAPGRGSGGGGGAPGTRASGRGVLGAPGASPGLFFAAGAGFALFALALSLVGCWAVSVQGYSISKALGISRFSGAELPQPGDRITNAMIKCTVSCSAPLIVQATSRKEAQSDL